MKPLLAMWEFLRWPAVLGLLGGLLLLQLFPQLNPRQSRPPEAPVAQQGPSGLAGRPSFAEAVRRASPSVVNIYTRKAVKRSQHRMFSDPLFRHYYNSADIPRQERMQSALGSGVIVSEDGYLLTNNHVIYGADEVVVQLQDGRESRARLVGVDIENDLAVLKVELENLSPIAIGVLESAQVGDVVLAIGNPFGMGQTVTLGIISATGRHGLNINAFENFIQTDAAINPGNSGGALIDAEGNLLGINTAILDRIGNSDLDGVGLAIPADTAVRALKDIVEFGRVVRGWLGVEAQSLTPQLAQSLQLESTSGILLTRIYADTPAQKAGLQPGDVIVRINEQAVGDVRRGRQQIGEGRPGETVAIEFYRNGRLERVQAVLDTNLMAS